VSEIKGYISSPAAFRPHAERLGVGELVFLAGLLMVLYAVTIDAVVVALGAIGNDLQVACRACRAKAGQQQSSNSQQMRL